MVTVREVAELVREQVPIRRLFEQVARYNDVAPGRPGAGALGELKDRGPPGREAPFFHDKAWRIGAPGRLLSGRDQRFEGGTPGCESLVVVSHRIGFEVRPVVDAASAGEVGS